MFNAWYFWLSVRYRRFHPVAHHITTASTSPPYLNPVLKTTQLQEGLPPHQQEEAEEGAAPLTPPSPQVTTPTLPRSPKAKAPPPTGFPAALLQLLLRCFPLNITRERTRGTWVRIWTQDQPISRRRRLRCSILKDCWAKASLSRLVASWLLLLLSELLTKRPARMGMIVRNSNFTFQLRKIWTFDMLMK